VSTPWSTTVNVNVDIALFGSSAVRRRLLRHFFSRPGTVRHVRELARELGYSATIVGRELDRLQRAGILTSELVGSARRYRVDEHSPIAAEIRSLVQKTIGVEGRIRQALEGVDGIEEAFLYGSYARGDERSTSDLDLLIVGKVDEEVLSDRLSDAERDLDRDINVVAYKRGELERMRAAHDRFLENVLAGPRVELVRAPSAE
jgi:predicted nucleotidyltransferase